MVLPINLTSISEERGKDKGLHKVMYNDDTALKWWLEPILE
jgi:hypothetical protein